MPISERNVAKGTQYAALKAMSLWMWRGSESPVSKFESALGAQKYLVSRNWRAIVRVRSDAFWNDRAARTRARRKYSPIVRRSPVGVCFARRSILEECNGNSGFT